MSSLRVPRFDPEDYVTYVSSTDPAQQSLELTAAICLRTISETEKKSLVPWAGADSGSETRTVRVGSVIL